jgi:hypothetical protein
LGVIIIASAAAVLSVPEEIGQDKTDTIAFERRASILAIDTKGLQDGRQ